MNQTIIAIIYAVALMLSASALIYSELKTKRMKNIYRLLRMLWTKRRRDRDAQAQRFDTLEHYLRCCRSFKDLEIFDRMASEKLLPKDLFTIRYDFMMARRFSKEKHLCRNERQRKIVAIKEGDHILSKLNLQ